MRLLSPSSSGDSCGKDRPSTLSQSIYYRGEPQHHGNGIDGNEGVEKTQNDRESRKRHTDREREGCTKRMIESVREREKDSEKEGQTLSRVCS